MDSRHYARRMVERLPRVLQCGPESNIAAIFKVLGQEMTHMLRGTNLLMRSRWHGLARGWSDPRADVAKKKYTELGLMGALFGLLPGKEESAEQYHQRVLDFIMIHRTGLGSAESLLRLAALVYRAVDEPIITWKGDTAVAKFFVPGGTPDNSPLKLELQDNPSQRAQRQIPEIKAGIEHVLMNNGLDLATPRIELTAKKSEVAMPMLEHLESGIRILYVGRVEIKKSLTLSNRKPPLLNRKPADGFMLVGHGFRFGQPDARFSAKDKGLKYARFPSFDSGSKRNFPQLIPGENRWRYRTMSHIGKKDFDIMAYDPGEELKRAPALALEFRWEERMPATFALRIPGDYVPPFFDQDLGKLEHALNRALEYGRAAGIRAKLEVLKPFRETLSLEDRLTMRTRTVLRSSHAMGENITSLAVHVEIEDRHKPDDRSLEYGRAAGIRAKLEVLKPFRETLSLADRLTMRTRTALRSSHAMDENITSLAVHVEIEDRHEPDDRFGTSGTFKNAYFDHSTFVKAGKKAEKE